MPTSTPETLLLLLLTVLFLFWLVGLARIDQPAAPRKASRPGPRPLRPRTADDCPQCRPTANAPVPGTNQAVIPYARLVVPLSVGDNSPPLTSALP